MKVVSLDVDGTLIRSTVFQAAADGLGFGEEVGFFDDLYFRGVISLETTFRAEYRLFLDREVDRVQAALRGGPWLPDIEEAVGALRDRGLRVWAVTDQPDWAVEVIEPWGVGSGVVSRTRRWGDRIGPVQRHAFEKERFLLERLRREGIAPGEVCHVGNGSNDVPVFEQVGFSVAFEPESPEVASAADAVVEGDGMGGVLEWVDAWRG